MQYYTTSESAKPAGQRCHVNDFFTNQIVLTCEGYFQNGGQNYFMLFDPSKPAGRQATVYVAIQIFDPASGALVWIPDTSRPVVLPK